MTRASTKICQGVARGRSEARWRGDCAAAERRDRERVALAGRIAELAALLRGDGCHDRPAALAELDRLYRAVAR